MNEEINIPNNLEIDKALKEFEMKSNMGQIPKAPEVSKDSGIKFEEDKWKQSVPSFRDEPPRMVRWVMKLSGGAITEQKQAEYVLFGFVVMAIIVSLFLFFGATGRTGQNEPPIYQEDLTPTIRETLPKDILKTIPYKYAK